MGLERVECIEKQCWALNGLEERAELWQKLFAHDSFEFGAD